MFLRTCLCDQLINLIRPIESFEMAPFGIEFIKTFELSLKEAFIKAYAKV